jgi:hypothetical protein
LPNQTVLRCQHCAADKNKKGSPWPNARDLKLHEQTCGLKAAAAANQQEPAHVHKFKLLNPNFPDHARAMQSGLTEICKECGEVT